VISSLLLWLVGLQQVFYRWLRSLEWNAEERKKSFSPLSLFLRKKTYRSCIVYCEECLSRLQWYVSRSRVRTWIAISQSVAVWKRTFFHPLPQQCSKECCNRSKQLKRTLRRRNRRYVPPANRKNIIRRVPRTDKWASLPRPMHHVIPLCDYFIRRPEIWATQQAWNQRWSKCISDWLETFDPSFVMGILSLDSGPPQDSINLSTTKIPFFKAFLSTLEDPKCFQLSSNEAMLIVDSGASVCISPHRSDFITYKTSAMRIKDLSSSNKVHGEGIIKWRVLNSSGQEISLEVPGYHIPGVEVRLLSPQVLLQLIGGSYTGSTSGIVISLDNDIELEAKYCPRSRLPFLPTCSVRPSHKSFWANTFTYSVKEASAYPALFDATNTNLSLSQKEVLLWHQRLSHASIKWIQGLMRDRTWLNDNANKANMHGGPFLPCKNSRTSSCNVTALKCAACLCAKASTRSPTNEPTRPAHNVTKQHVLKRGHLEPGDCISIDQYVSKVQGRLPFTFGRERNGYTCGTLFIDHASGKIFNFCQLSNNANETLSSKSRLEAFAREESVTIKKFHTDNGIFASAAFKEDCNLKKQKLTFSGVGAHHQNGVAERNIKTISQWARASMLHAAHSWPDVASIKLWPQAVDYAVWVFNHLPNLEVGVSPNELWSRTRFPTNSLGRAHVFGCPVYVLDPKLQDGHKIPKWDPRARLGMFVGFSPLHSSLVPLVLNILTGKISPQYHVVFDDKFETVPSLPLGESLQQQWNHILTFPRECYLDVDVDHNGFPINPPSGYTWDSPPKPLPLKSRGDPEIPEGVFGNDSDDAPVGTPEGVAVGVPQRTQAEQQVVGVPEGVAVGVPQRPPVGQQVREPTNKQEGASTGTPVKTQEYKPVEDTAAPPPAPQLIPHEANDDQPNNAPVPPLNALPPTRPRRQNVGTWKDGPARIRASPMDNESYEFHILLDNACDSPAAFITNHGHITFQPQPHRISKTTLLDCTLLQDPWENPTDLYGYMTMDSWDPQHINDCDPRLLAVKSTKSKYNDDNPSYDTAVRGPFQAEYWKAMQVELNTLENDFKCWDLVPRTPDMNVISSTWALKVKRYPDGSVKKFKARFCARGDQQKEGIDFFETWSPVVQWSTIRIVMILTALRGWKSVQCDITAAFIHALLKPGEEIYVHQPRGFKLKENHVLKLRRSLYGLRQAPRYFFEYFTERLVRQGLTPSKYDPCLFFSKTLIVIIYVDDILIYCKDEAEIDDFITRMRSEDVALHKEGTADGYLGVDIQRDGTTITLTQSGLTKRIIKALGLDSKYSTSCNTPAEKAPLPRDADGPPASGTLNYASIIGMLLYLTGHSRLDCSFATNQCARYTFAPTRKHENALIQIGRYLKGTINKGLILSPSETLHIDCYPDSDFAGLWKYEDSQDPHCVRSRTGYVITLANCPILWSSKLQTEIALSTMEAEYVALSTSCKDLFPIIDLTTELCLALDVNLQSEVDLHVKIHEDNAGALTLSNLEPRRMTPRSKHYAVKYHWFREHIGPRNIKIIKIPTESQLGDLFTKGLCRVAFERLRKKLMGW